MQNEETYVITKREDVYIDEYPIESEEYRIHQGKRTIGNFDRKDDGEWYLQHHSVKADDLRVLATILDNLNKGVHPMNAIDGEKYEERHEMIVEVDKGRGRFLGTFSITNHGPITFQAGSDWDDLPEPYSEEDMDKIFEVYQDLKEKRK